MTERAENSSGTAVFLPVGAHSLQRHPDFRRQALARGVSVVGSVAAYLVLPVLAYQLTGSGVWTALVAAAGCLPHLAGRRLADVVASWLTPPSHGDPFDRLDRRRLLVAADLANGVLLASVPVAFMVDALTAPHVLLAALGTQGLFVFYDAANVGTPPYRPGRDRVGVPLFGGGTALRLTAPLLGSALLVLTSAPPLLTVDGVSIIVSVLLVRAIATPRQTTTPSQVLRPKWTVDFRPLVRVHTMVWALHAAAGGAFLGQFAPWAHQGLGVEPVRDIRLGVLLALWAVGGRLAASVLPGLADRFGADRVTPVFLPLAAVCGLACALAPHWVVAALALPGLGLTYMVVVLDQQIASGAGRIVSFGLGWPAGALLGGLVAAGPGPRAGIAVAAALSAAAAAVAWLTRPGTPLSREPRALSRAGTPERAGPAHRAR